MSLEDEPTGELPGPPEGDQPGARSLGEELGPGARWRGEVPAPEGAGAASPGPGRTAPRDATSRADKRRNQRR
ncbi:hypothetical protein [Asanoa sp. NPDC050611]|uniref:hypothetical protein n=1 Tax=Asanoa sp. NPDC050611 TaxID=3157098 RepID=UPI0033F14DF2